MRVTLSWFGAQRGRDDAATFERDAAIRLAKGLARWLLRQSNDMKRMIKAALIDGAVVNLSDLLRRVRQYFEREAEKGMPEEVLRQIRLICRNGFERVFEDTEAEEQTRIDEAWIDGFDERYAGKMSARLNGANDASVRRALGSGSKERVETALAALDTWAHMRSQNMARNETPMALNEALIAGFRACGYTSVWKSAPSCCSLCKSYNDRTVTRLKPPLHLYCWCGVGKGEKYELKKPTNSDILHPWDTSGINDMPPDRSLSNEEARKWYIEQDKKIPAWIDKTKPLETQARQACSLRNAIRTKARDLMEDQETREMLDRTQPNKSFEELLEKKMKAKNMTREEAMQDIVNTATKTNSEVNKKLGLE